MNIPSDLLVRCCFLAGPTAVGKTEASLRLAERLDAEIVSLDSMAIYRGMDIGTAKPNQTERKRVPHHLIDVADPHQEFSTAQYLQLAERAAREILSRGKIPLFVGGTGLYLRSLLRGVFEGPAADWEYRKQLESIEQHEPGCLWRRLERSDPATAARLHPNDRRRIIRALEVEHLTGVPMSEQQRQTPLTADQRPSHVYWLHPPRDWLAERINRRVEIMIEQGLIDEVKRLLNHQPPPGRSARQSLGYKEVIDHLHGKQSLPDTIEQIQTRTRQFAKRQHTWFRNLEECQEIVVTPAATTTDLVNQLTQRLQGSAREL